MTLPIVAGDGATSELLWLCPPGEIRHLLYWLPAMGVAAKHYLPLAEALAARGIAVALHEWRGIGSSNRRAGRHSDWAYNELLTLDLPAGLAAAQAQLPARTGCWLGGHSLGGQLSALYASLHPREFAGLALVASGSPFWRRFKQGWLIGLACVLAPWLAQLIGRLPGRQLGFAGNEARGVIADWARSGRTGRYAAKGMAEDFERQLSALEQPVLGLSLSDDWLGPPASMDWLLGKMPKASREQSILAPLDLGGTPADHFSWMKSPDVMAERIAQWMMKSAATLR
ncbi:alpha/beta fold hydrolase [Dyella tabacisoli]|uniref:Alpha/beta fold hydrolase n=1 Tax=Dyella tabacisoli TaxID=2282381 RepID=A0A369UQI7_9GAMM|nr:alpha/beta fold hydrolase [Dyella tabacisoli]RDD81880.1 alpha/beta fold hydrolase [Dyella tabacisoli]